MLLDTCLLIDIERGRPAARSFFAENLGERFCISAITRGEMAAGLSPERWPGLWTDLARFQLLPVGQAVSEEYANVFRRLRGAGSMIGANDLWIAATALAHNVPLVTRNVAEFTRVPRLRVVGY